MTEKTNAELQATITRHEKDLAILRGVALGLILIGKKSSDPIVQMTSVIAAKKLLTELSDD